MTPIYCRNADAAVVMCENAKLHINLLRNFEAASRMPEIP